MLSAVAVDTHTHTVLSGHAWSTLRENARAAAERGLAGLCVTEHGHALPGAGPFYLTATQNMLPPVMEGVRMHYGVEANIMDFAGRLDVDVRMLRRCRFVIASMHDLCMTPGSPAENTSAFIAALSRPEVDALGHPDDGKTPSDLDAVVRSAAELGKLIEINNNSILIRKGSPERMLEIARFAVRHGARLAVASDAHVDEMVGAVGPALAILARAGVPDELVVNRTAEAFDDYLAERQKRLARAAGNPAEGTEAAKK